MADVQRMTDLPVICLAGPTAAGKSAAILALAQRWPVEIINVDSATIYRGMDIGTAKPTRDEQSLTPQHLLDIRDPAQSYSAAEFCRDTLALLPTIIERGRIPVLAGGTMLYYKALRDGLDDLPQADPTLRREIEARAAKQGWAALHAELALLDPVTAARLAPGDSQRIQRALEICILSGGPMSALLSRTPKETPQDAAQDSDQSSRTAPGIVAALGDSPRSVSPGGSAARDDRRTPEQSSREPTGCAGEDLTDAGARTAYGAAQPASPSGWRWLTISLEPSDRLALHARIAQRFEAMMTRGLVAEVSALKARTDLHAGLPSIRCVGYRQIWSHLAGEISLAEAQEQAIAATRQLAKRQLTWLRSQPERHIVDCLRADAAQEVVSACAPIMNDWTAAATR